jgi:polyketide cyclase/dehydrase/lipid transport protein
MRDGGMSRYRFRSDWWVDAPPHVVYAVLERGEEYPRWWPQIREAVVTGPDTGECRFRSLLPFELRVTVRATRHEPAAGVLEAALGGDLDGWIRWSLTSRGRGTRVRYEQDTELRRPLLRRISWVARPALLANHALMMRSGRSGLRAAAGSSADGPPP